MNASRTRATRSFAPAIFFLTLFFISIAAIPVIPSVRAASPQSIVSVASTQSSAACFLNQVPSVNSFSCSLKTTAGSTLVAFLGCLTAQDASCESPSVVDSRNDTFALRQNVQSGCDGPVCIEYLFVATASSTGNDTLTFSTASTAYLGADVYDVLGINKTGFDFQFSSSNMNGPPVTLMKSNPVPGSFSVAGVVANNAGQFGATGGFSLIPNQPCYSCGMKGGWQASEYAIWGSGVGPTDYPFAYPQTNDGWTEAGLTFFPNVSHTSVSCTPSTVMVALQSTCTAKVKGDSPTGTVAWNVTGGTGTFSPPSCSLSSSGSCSVSYTPSAPSSSTPVTIIASYAGDLENPGSSGNSSLSAVKHSTSVTARCTPSPVAIGSPTICTATVSGASPTGTLTWASSGVADFSPAATCTLSGSTCAVNYTPSSATSPVTITAIYSGDGNNVGSMGNFSLDVGTATTSSSPSSSTSSTQTTASGSNPSSSSAVGTTSARSSAATSSTAAGSSALPWSYVAIAVVNVAMLLALGGIVRTRKRKVGR